MSLTQKEKVRAFIESTEYTPMTAENISVCMCVPQCAVSELNSILDELVSEGSVIIGKKKRYFSSKTLGLLRGVFKSTGKGYGFVNIENDNYDIYIPEKYIYGAMNGDTVLVRLRRQSSHAQKREGEILYIVSRAVSTFVGTFSQERGYGIVNPDDEKLPDEIFVLPQNCNGAINGQKVVAKITEYASPTTSLCCSIIEILGFPYDFGVDILSVIKSHGFNTDFPDSVILEAKALPDKVRESDLTGRLDLTDKTVITIDGDDTKDIDDAVSIEKTSFGYRLGVHIADVSHYVKPHSELDMEAYKRGTSVYLSDRVIPMLPVKLSNDLCSLNEGVIRLTLSVFIDFDFDGNITGNEFYKSYIKSSARMTYDNVRLILSEHPNELCDKYKNIVPYIEDMYELAVLLNKKTKQRGAINFNIPEAKALLDSDGKAVDIVLRENTFANNIIEEFMICANECVAKKLSELKIPAIYRVHDKPDSEKLKNILRFLNNAGYEKCESINERIETVYKTDGESVICSILLRCMAKALYRHLNSGHYGLALDNYCHFTSPIRRYPDLICHRALKAYIESDTEIKNYLASFVQGASEQCSKCEYEAAMCERDALDTKKAEFMMSFVGNEFDGIISSVTNFGFFVMLPNTVEGIVRIENLHDDYYVYNDKALSLIGEHTGKSYTIGEKITVKLISSDKTTRKIEFILPEGGKQNAGKRYKKNTRTKQKRISRVFHRRKARGRH